MNVKCFQLTAIFFMGQPLKMTKFTVLLHLPCALTTIDELFQSWRGPETRRSVNYFPMQSCKYWSRCVQVRLSRMNRTPVFLPWSGRWSGCPRAGLSQTAGSPRSRGPPNPGSPPSAASPPLQHNQEEEGKMSSLYSCSFHSNINPSLS